MLCSSTTLSHPTLSYLKLGCTPFYVITFTFIFTYIVTFTFTFPFIFLGIFGGFEADPLMCGAFQGAHLAIPAFVAALCCTTAYILLPPKPSSGSFFAYSLSCFWKRKRNEGLSDSNNESYGSYGGVSLHSHESNTLTGNLHFIL